MSYTNFDRHENMSKETLEEIMDLTMYRSEERGRVPFSLKNKLYGLFDGYLYDDLLTEADEFGDEELVERIEKIVVEVSSYPSGQTQV